jgi:ABC-type Fe3+ transport system permease subunit
VENGAPEAAAATGLVLILIALLVFVVLTFVTRRWTQHG